jgi:acyl-CoA synthetase (AMP-forming)/AMP-acid ligase II
MAMLPSFLSCNGADNFHCWCCHARYPCLYHEEVRLRKDAGSCAEIPHHNPDHGSPHRRSMFPSTNLFYPSSNIHQALAKSPLTKKYDLSSVRDIGSGAAPLGGEVIEECEALWPARDRRLTQGWGMTEVTCSLLGWDPTSASIDPNSVGELNANCSAKIMDADGKNEVPVGQRGEIWVQGPK